MHGWMETILSEDAQSITFTSGVCALTRVASGEQDYMSSGVSVLAHVAGYAGEGI
jgi:hypothetical protein